MSNDTELLHASVIKRIWKKCKEEDMDIVAFAWRIQREAERAAVEAAQPEAVGEPTDADWADFGAWAERDKGAMNMLEKLIDVWDDGQLPHEHRCYVDGAWAELIAEARALLAAAPTTEATSSSDAERLDAARYRWLRENNAYSIHDRLFADCPMNKFNDAMLDAAIDAAILATKKGTP